MAYQALLFCPDDKTARTVTQVLSELEFSVEACTEPFAAVKKLMSQHFDALVVDCDNEQNATLLFKSARNSTSNQASLAVAIVEGQAGVAKAFRIGANLVLTKPINVEQSKGTLRVARGLLRKGDPGKPAATAPAVQAPAAPAPAAPAPPAPAASVAPAATPKPIPAKPAVPARPSAPAAVLPPRPAQPPLVKPAVSVAAAQAAASSGLDEDIAQAGSSNRANISGSAPVAAQPTPAAAPTPKPAAAPAAAPAMRLPFMGAPEGPAGGFRGGAASAPAPARETNVVHPEKPAAATRHAGEDLFEAPAAPVEAAQVAAPAVASPAQETATTVSSAPEPSFTFGGANVAEESGGGSKRILFGLVAAVLVCVAGYFGWNHFRTAPSETPVQMPVAASSPAPTASTPQPIKPSATSSGSLAAPVQTAVTNPPSRVEEDDSADTAESSLRNSGKSTSGPGVSSGKSPEPVKPADAPLIVKGGAAPSLHTKTVAADTPAPSVIGMQATGSGGALSNLVPNNANSLKPMLQSVNISQGVSQGLLMKKVSPVYPRAALAMHIEGIVEVMATISKNGDITTVKVLSGDPQLTRSAVDAVKQWKYKPYLLNGEPVEIQTQVTISFKLPH